MESFRDWFLRQPEETRDDRYFFRQMEIIYLQIPFALSRERKEEEKIRNSMRVVSTYKLNSFVLPVVMIGTKEATFYVKSDLNNIWVISVDSEKNVPKGIAGFDHSGVVDCFGMPEKFVFESIQKNQKRFTAKATNELLMQLFFVEFSNIMRWGKN